MDEIVNKILYSPVVATIVGVLASTLCILLLLSQTTIGKKALKTLKSKFADTDNKVDAALEDIKTFKSDTDKCVEDFEEHIRMSDNFNGEQFSSFYYSFQYFKDEVFSVLEQIPNAKVKNQIALIKDKTKQFEEEVNLLVEKDENMVAEHYKTVQEMELLKDKIKELEENFNVLTCEEKKHETEIETLDELLEIEVPDVPDLREEEVVEENGEQHHEDTDTTEE